MKIHAHFGGGVLCGQANAKSIPLHAFMKLVKGQCKRCLNRKPTPIKELWGVTSLTAGGESK